MHKYILGLVLTSSLVFSASMDFDKDTKGLVRHLKVYKAPRWVSKVELSSGKSVYFCSPKSMLEFYHHPGKWIELNIKSENDFKKILVTDFKTLEPIDAKGAFYVYGATIISPAGDDLVPFSSYKDAKEYAAKYMGRRILNFKEIKNSLIRLLNGRI
ncbi:MAG: hypothetical protein COB17_04690 [Sulfurimonas sp.]|nr:MAG: hypothetical protein COB17_04690 [Sulfurimonas sp.]